MNAAIWRSLLWKEWREHRWKLAALVAIAIGVPTLAAVSAGDDHPFDAIMVALMICSFLVLPLGGVFVAMGLAASERSGRTLPFLQGMPLSMPRLAITKLVIGAVTAWLPQLIIIVLAVVPILIDRQIDWHGKNAFFAAILPFSMLGPLFDAPLAALLTTISLLLWTAAPAVNSASEVRAGAIGLAVIAGVWTLMVGVMMVLGGLAMDSLIADHRYLAAALPGGVMTLVEPTPSRRLTFIAIIASYLLTHLPLAWWYVTRFGRVSVNADRIQGSTAGGWLGAPFGSRFKALAWKQRRECLPVVVAGAACAVSIPTFWLLGNVFINGEAATSLINTTSFGDMIIGMFGFFGALAGLVTGIGSSVTELEPKLANFWRSRPIHIDQWFWTAFAAGLLLLGVVFVAPIFLSTFLIGPYNGWTQTLVATTAAAAAYAAGWLSGGVLRHAVYASLIGVGLVIVPMWAGVSLHNWLLRGDQLELVFMGVALLISAVVMTVAAWVCVRNDWSLRLS